MRHKSLGRYSFLMADPIEFMHWQAGDASCLAWLEQQLRRCRVEPIQGLPPFQGGVAGVIGYEFNQALDNIPAPRGAIPDRPAVCLGSYDTVVAWDHELNRTWILSHGLDRTNRKPRMESAQRRIEQLAARLADEHEPDPVATNRSQPPKGKPSRITSNLSRDDYLQMVQRALQYIHGGDVFQVNLAQHLRHPAVSNPIDLFLRLRQNNPSTFAGYFDAGHAQIISASPERLAAVRERRIETRPIKGTIQRTGDADRDRRLAAELSGSEKDRAENVMIVDLMRNDLSRICTDDSVRVTQLLGVESYASVMHLVSAVEGQLQERITAADVIRAVFPGGSISGAPKIRAMEIIAELESSPRDAYCGSLGYFGFDGSIDLNILIRTITAADGWWHIPVGGGIVADSDPPSEYEETWTKAAGMLDSLLPDESELVGDPMKPSPMGQHRP